jgi:anhydro-N-acetylmuramic acid kinase
VIAVGLMSGTSLDGIDAALVRIEPRGNSYAIDLLGFATVPFEPGLGRALREALPPEYGTTELVARLDHELGIAFARAARQVADGTAIAFVASHGQTAWHDGERRTTLQIGDPFVVREALGVTVCYDFRRADCAAGGHGAPLVPYVDALLIGSGSEDRVALNVGGIANLTALPKEASPNDVLAFDTGPGVMMIDAFVRIRTGGEQTMDRGGALAASGAVDESLLDTMLEDPYFALPPPKTTGRERFGEQFLKIHALALDRLSLEDGCATLTEVTAASIANAVADLDLQRPHVFCSGGGVRNEALMRSLAKRLEDARIETTDVLGIPPDAKEAIAFAVLGYETLRERAASSPRATGASRAVPLGAIAPCGLRALIGEVERECR